MHVCMHVSVCAHVCVCANACLLNLQEGSWLVLVIGDCCSLYDDTPCNSYDCWAGWNKPNGYKLT